MATVKVKLRPSTVPGKAGTYLLSIDTSSSSQTDHYEDTSSSQKLG